MEAYGHAVVCALVPMSQGSVRRLDAVLRAADRRIGVALGSADGGGVRLLVLSEDSDPDAAVARARRALAEADAPEATWSKSCSAASARAGRGVQRPQATLRTVRWSRRTVGAQCRARGPMGDWVVTVGDRGHAWRGRSLFDVLYEALELPSAASTTG